MSNKFKDVEKLSEKLKRGISNKFDDSSPAALKKKINELQLEAIKTN